MASLYVDFKVMPFGNNTVFFVNLYFIYLENYNFTVKRIYKTIDFNHS